MIHTALNLIKDRLNDYLRLKAKVTGDTVNYLDGSQMEPISFTLNAISLLLINIEEERTLRNPDQFAGITRNGVRVGPSPEVRISLLMLFVTRFTDYDQSMKFLSLVIRFFQANTIFDVRNTPGLAPEIDELHMELQTMPIAQQNELWNGLRTTYLPSVAYRAGILVYRDEETIELLNQTQGIQRDLKRAQP